jgi:hypothetical protein
MGSFTASPQAPYYDILGTIYQRLRVDAASVNIRALNAIATPCAIAAYPSTDTSGSLGLADSSAQPHGVVRVINNLAAASQPFIWPRGGSLMRMDNIVSDGTYYGSVNYSQDFADNPGLGVNLLLSFESIDGSTNLDLDLLITVRQRVTCWRYVSVSS